jgi:ATP-binding cassette subfamily B (MDR/TAP) protein 1
MSRVDDRKKKGYGKRIIPFNKPAYMVFLGVILSLIKGAVFPVFSIFFSKIIFNLQLTLPFQLDDMKDQNDKYCLYLLILSLVCGVCINFQKYTFGVVGENMTKYIREMLYISILQKDIGYFDHKENSPGNLTAVLSGEVQHLNGVGTESIAVMLESFFSLSVGIGVSFYYSWKVACVALGCAPFMIFSAAYNAKLQMGFNAA